MSSPETYVPSSKVFRGTKLPDVVLARLREDEAAEPSPHPSDPPYVVEYAYPTTTLNGTPSTTSLGFDFPTSASEFPKKGAELKLHGTTFTVEAVATGTEVVDGRTVLFCAVTVRLA